MPSQSTVPSSAPPPPPQSHGGIYILAAVVLLAAIGGLLCWKLKGGNEAAVTPVLPTPPTNTPTLADPPPPPPPPIPDEVAHGPDGGAHVASSSASPCGPKCAGRGNTAMEAALNARSLSTRPCYERALRVNSTLQGKMMVNVRIDSQGNVCSTGITQDAIHSTEVANCVMGMFRSAKFPPPSGGCVDVNVPLSFVPREGK